MNESIIADKMVKEMALMKAALILKIGLEKYNKTIDAYKCFLDRTTETANSEIPNLDKRVYQLMTADTILEFLPLISFATDEEKGEIALYVAIASYELEFGNL